MAFNTQTAYIARMNQLRADYEKRINKIEQELIELKIENALYKTELEQAEKFIDIANKCAQDGDTVQQQYILELINNINKKPKGRRYTQLHAFYALISFAGEHYYKYLKKELSFPSYRTAMRYRNKFLKVFNLSDYNFDGSKTSIEFLKETYLDGKPDTKCILTVDAASVTKYVSVSNNGTVKGLLKTTYVEVSYATTLTNNETQFQEFLRNHKDEIISAEFVFMLCPLNPYLRPFPVKVHSASSATATVEFSRDILKFAEKLEKHQIPICGIGTDGDNAYAYYRYMLQYIDNIRNSLSSMTIQEFAQEKHPLFHFCDPFHLAKRDRSHKINVELFRFSPTTSTPYGSVELLMSCGIPPYVFTRDNSKKMDDQLPLRIFNLKIVKRVVEKENKALLFSILPTTLLLEAIHSPTMSRTNRIECLMYGFSLIYIYYKTQEITIFERPKVMEKGYASYMKESCFTQTWCEQYISVTLGIASLLCTEKELHLGALGSHFVEHLFGNVRRISRGDNTHTKFLKTMQLHLLEEKLCNELNIRSNKQERRSDSGVIVTDPLPSEFLYFGDYLLQAKQLMDTFIKFYNNMDFSWIHSTNDINSKETIIENILNIQNERSNQISTKSTSMIANGVQACKIIWKAEQELDDILE